MHLCCLQEEAKTVTKDLAGAIAGANAKTSQLASGEGTLEAITKDMVCQDLVVAS